MLLFDVGRARLENLGHAYGGGGSGDDGHVCVCVRVSVSVRHLERRVGARGRGAVEKCLESVFSLHNLQKKNVNEASMVMQSTRVRIGPCAARALPRPCPCACTRRCVHQAGS